MNLHVGNLPWVTSSDDLYRLFVRYGAVARAQVITDHQTGRSSGYGFVEMPADDEARRAIEALNGHRLGGRPIRVSEAHGAP